MPDMSGMLFIGLGLFILFLVAFLSLKQYKVAIFLVVLTPMFPLLRFVNSDEFTGDPFTLGSYIRILLLGVLGIVGFITFIRARWEDREKLTLPLLLLGVFILFALFSTVYSYDRTFTSIRALSFLAFYGFLLGFYSWLTSFSRLSDAFSMVVPVLAGALLVNMAAAVIFPDLVWWWKLPSRYQGIWGNPNSLGALCMVSYPIFLWKYGESQKKLTRAAMIILLGLTGMMHILTGSRASLGAALFGIFIWLLISRQRVKFTLLWLALLVGALTVSQSDIPSFNRFENKGLIDVTGREEMWKSCFQLIWNKPFLGYGFDIEGNVWSAPEINRTEYTREDANARAPLHDGYISIMIGTGVPSLILLVMIWLWPFRRLRGMPPFRHKLVVFYYFFGVLFMNFFESCISGGRTVPSILFWISWVIVLRLPYLSTDVGALSLADEKSVLYFFRADWEKHQNDLRKGKGSGEQRVESLRKGEQA